MYSQKFSAINTEQRDASAELEGLESDSVAGRDFNRTMRFAVNVNVDEVPVGKVVTSALGKQPDLHHVPAAM